MKIMAAMTAPPAEKSDCNVEQSRSFGSRPGVPVHPGARVEEPFLAYHPKPVVMEELWQNTREETGAYKNYCRSLSSGAFGCTKSQSELEGLRSRGFMALNLNRDDHIIAAHCHLAYKQNALPFAVLVSLCEEYRSRARKTNPASFTPRAITQLMQVINLACGVELAPIPEFSERVRLEALRLIRMQPFMRTSGLCHRSGKDSELDRQRVDRCEQYVELLVNHTPDTFSVRANTMAKIALQFTAAKEGFGPEALCEQDRPFISRKMKKIVNVIRLNDNVT